MRQGTVGSVGPERIVKLLNVDSVARGNSPIVEHSIWGEGAVVVVGPGDVILRQLLEDRALGLSMHIE